MGKSSRNLGITFPTTQRGQQNGPWSTFSMGHGLVWPYLMRWWEVKGLCRLGFVQSACSLCNTWPPNWDCGALLWDPCREHSPGGTTTFFRAGCILKTPLHRLTFAQDETKNMRTFPHICQYFARNNIEQLTPQSGCMIDSFQFSNASTFIYLPSWDASLEHWQNQNVLPARPDGSSSLATVHGTMLE